MEFRNSIGYLLGTLIGIALAGLLFVYCDGSKVGAVVEEILEGPSLDRCKKYYRRVLMETNYHIGRNEMCFDDFELSKCMMNQIRVESSCREEATAPDGGEGLAQFMPATGEWIHGREEALREFDYNPYDSAWAIRAMILYDKLLYDTCYCIGWYYAYRSYNGGLENLHKEIRRAGSCDKSLVELQCRRARDFCRINIDYPYKIMNEEWF